MENILYNLKNCGAKDNGRHLLKCIKLNSAKDCCAAQQNRRRELLKTHRGRRK